MKNAPFNRPLPAKKEQHHQWFSESEGGYNSSPVKAKMMRDYKRSNRMHRVANKSDFPSDSHRDRYLKIDKATRVRQSELEASTDERAATIAQEHLGL